MLEEWYSDDIIYCLEHINEFSDEYLKEKLYILAGYVGTLTFGAQIIHHMKDKNISGDTISELMKYKEYKYVAYKCIEPVDLMETASNMPIKYGKYTAAAYDIPLEKLTHSEVLLLICYPFWSRMGGSFEFEFAKRGDLLRYLLRLKEIEEGMCPAIQIL